MLNPAKYDEHLLRGCPWEMLTKLRRNKILPHGDRSIGVKMKNRIRILNKSPREMQGRGEMLNPAKFAGQELRGKPARSECIASSAGMSAQLRGERSVRGYKMKQSSF